MTESTQKKLSRVRPPRVQITYDVEIGDAIESKELPLVVGILADLAGNDKTRVREPLRERKLVEIDRDNFNKVMEAVHPHLSYRVADTLKGGDAQLGVNLAFASLDDFSPHAVARQVPDLNTLLDARQRLVDLIAKLDGNEQLDVLMQQILKRAEAEPGEVDKLRAELTQGSGDGSGGGTPDEPPAPPEG